MLTHDGQFINCDFSKPSKKYTSKQGDVIWGSLEGIINLRLPDLLKTCFVPGSTLRATLAQAEKYERGGKDFISQAPYIYYKVFGIEAMRGILMGIAANRYVIEPLTKQLSQYFS